MGDGCWYAGEDTSANIYLVRNITADLTVKVPVTAKTFTAQLDVAGNWTNAKLYADCDGAVNRNVLTDSSSTAFEGTTAVGSIHAGDTVTVGFEKAYDGHSVYTLEVETLSGKDVEVVGVERTGVFYFVMPAESVKLTVRYEAAKFDVNFVGADGVILTADGTAKVAKATPNQPYTFNAVAKAGYVLKSITYTGNGLSGNLSNQNNPYTISADAVVNGLTVTFNTELKKFDVTLRTANGVTGMAPTVVELGDNVSRTYADQTVQSVITFTVNAKSDVISVVSSDSDAVIRFTETGNNTTRVTVAGMTEAGTITVSRAN